MVEARRDCNLVAEIPGERDQLDEGVCIGQRREHRRRSVGRAVIDEHEFEFGALPHALPQAEQARNKRCNTRFLVEEGDDDRERQSLWKHGVSYLPLSRATACADVENSTATIRPQKNTSISISRLKAMLENSEEHMTTSGMMAATLFSRTK